MRVTAAIVSACVVAAAAGPSGQGTNPVSGAIKHGWDGAKRNVRESAELMSEANYGFKPVDSVRTFGQILAHVAGASYVFCAAAKGEKTPFSEDHFETIAKTKADIVKSVSDSIAYCDGAYGALTDAKASEPIEMPFGMGKAARAAALMNNTNHLNEHYGNLVTYFRIKGITPPSSARNR
jgi:uncharacterized damage-inducible protein DinB